MISIQNFPSDAIPLLGVRDSKELLGKFAIVDFAKGELILNRRLVNDANRYMGLERLTISCINLNANSMVVRFSPQLEAMKYTSPAGITYDYFDFFKKHVYFPADSTVSFTSGKAIWKYSLPLANETLSWKNVRKRPKYYVDVIINRDGYSELRKYYIDITGNVTDIIKPQ